MSWLYGITRAERLAAEQLTSNSLCTIEIAANLLGDIWDRYFSEAEQKALDSTETGEVGRSLYAAHYMITDAVRAYHCEMGHYDENCVEAFHYNAKKYEKVCESERLWDEAMCLKCADAAGALHLNTDEAIKLLNEVIERKKAEEKAE